MGNKNIFIPIQASGVDAVIVALQDKISKINGVVFIYKYTFHKITTI